jgi:hypothetical protein
MSDLDVQNINSKTGNSAIFIADDGNVGIGTTTPNSAGLGFNGQTLQLGTRTFIATDPGGDTRLGGLSGSNITGFYQGGTERMRITSSGRVGIGTSSPSSKLHVTGDATNYGILAEQPSGYGGFNIKSTTLAQTWSFIANDNGSNSDLLLYGGSSAGTKLVVDSSGNVGIGTGTSTPAGLLHLKFFGTTNGLYLQNTSGAVEYASFTANPATGEVRIGGTNAGAGAYFPTFYSNGLERMRIDTSGNVLVGRTNTSFGAGTAGLFITSTGRLLNEVSGDSTLALNRTDGTGTTNIVSFYRGNIYAGAIQTAASGTPSFTSASDARLKNNIVSHESELANVMSLRPTRWDWKNESLGSGEGFIAQDLEQTAWSDLVSEGDDGYKQVAGLGVVETRLIKAIQEQQAMIEELKAEVAALKGA